MWGGRHPPIDARHVEVPPLVVDDYTSDVKIL